MDACNISPLMISRRPWRFKAARVVPRATTLTIAPARERRAAIMPPIAPAPIMQNFGVRGTVAGLRAAQEPVKEDFIFNSELLDMQRGDSGRESDLSRLLRNVLSSASILLSSSPPSPSLRFIANSFCESPLAQNAARSNWTLVSSLHW